MVVLSDPQGVPNNLMPYLAQVAVGRREELVVYGNDYPTPDGTGERDYLHVMDLADGHLAALRHGHGRSGLHVFNLGTGRGHSVLEMLDAFGRACGRRLPHRIAPRRQGDVASSWADPRTPHRRCAGKPPAASTTWVPTPGTGNPTTRRATRHECLRLRSR